MDPRFHRSDLGRRDRRDLFVGEAFDIAEEKTGALVRRNGRERIFYDCERFAIGGEVSELGARRHRLSPAN